MGIRRGFEDGSSGFINKFCYGYRKSEAGTLVIYEPEAKVVDQIYQWRVYGYSLRKIAELLSEGGIPTPRGGKRRGVETLNKLLHNKKYTGNVILQKIFLPDVLTGKQINNNGQIAKYYVEDTHEGVIAKDIFDKVNGAH